MVEFTELPDDAKGLPNDSANKIHWAVFGILVLAAVAVAIYGIIRAIKQDYEQEIFGPPVSRLHTGGLVLAIGSSALGIILTGLAMVGSFKSQDILRHTIIPALYIIAAIVFLVLSIIFSKSIVVEGVPDGNGFVAYYIACIVVIILIVVTGAIQRRNLGGAGAWLACLAFCAALTAFVNEWPWWSGIIATLIVATTALIWLKLSAFASITLGSLVGIVTFLSKLLDDERDTEDRDSTIGLAVGFFGVCAMLLAGLAVMVRRPANAQGWSFDNWSNDQMVDTRHMYKGNRRRDVKAPKEVHTQPKVTETQIVKRDPSIFKGNIAELADR